MSMKKSKLNRDLSRRSLIIILIMVMFLIIGVLVVSFKNYSFDYRVGADYEWFGRRYIDRREKNDERVPDPRLTPQSSPRSTPKSTPEPAHRLYPDRNNIRDEYYYIRDDKEWGSFFDVFIGRLLRKIRPKIYAVPE